MIEGISSRGAERHTNKSISKSAAPRMWVNKSLEQLEGLRGRNLSKLNLLVVLINGVSTGEEMIVIALGIDNKRKKHALDFEIGSSQFTAVIEALTDRPSKRGLVKRTDRRLLVVRDGNATTQSILLRFPSPRPGFRRASRPSAFSP